MKKIFSMFLIYIMLMPIFSVQAAESNCLITFGSTEATCTIDGTLAYVNGHYQEDAQVATKGGKTGWILTPNTSYTTICINLKDSFMNKLSGSRDVLMDVSYYDGDSTDAGRKFCVYYVSQKHASESAGIIELTGSGNWKTKTFLLEKPYLSDVGNSPLRNICISVQSTYMGASDGSVVIGLADIYYGEERDLLVELSSENIGNIFFNKEPIEFDLFFENPNKIQHGELTVKLKLTNKADESVYQTEKTITAGNLTSFIEKISLESLNLPFGTYSVSAEIYNSNDELVESYETELSRVSAIGNMESASGKFNNSFHGINTHAGRFDEETIKKLMHLAKRAGVGHLRITFSWESIETSEGVYQLSSSLKKVMEEIKTSGIKVMVVLGNKNSSVYPDYKPYRTGSTEENFQKYLEKYSAFVKEMVREYDDSVESWEIYNEYVRDYPGYGNNATDAMAEAAAKDYADILKTGYNAVKDINPEAVVVGGALEDFSVKDNFIGKLFESFDAAEYMDALSYHGYTASTDTGDNTTKHFDTAQNLKKYINAAGKNYPVYLDEFNFVSSGSLTEIDRALYNVRFLTKVKYDKSIDRVYSYNLESPGYTGKYSYGLIDYPVDDYDALSVPGGAELGFLTISFMNKLLSNGENKNFTEDENGNYIYEFLGSKEERPVYVIWNKDDIESSATISLEGEELVSYDMFGNETGSGSGSISIATGKQPVYVTVKGNDYLLDQDDDVHKVTMSGVGTADNKISIIVLKKGKSEADFSQVEQILYADQGVTNSEGEWSFTFKITEGNGEYSVILTEESESRYVYNLSYDAGKLRVTYSISQNGKEIEDLTSLSDGALDIGYKIDNHEGKKSGYVIIGCLYKGNELKKVAMSKEGQISDTILIDEGSFIIPDIKKADTDKIKILIFDSAKNIYPLCSEFSLE